MAQRGHRRTRRASRRQRRGGYGKLTTADKVAAYGVVAVVGYYAAYSLTRPRGTTVAPTPY